MKENQFFVKLLKLYVRLIELAYGINLDQLQGDIEIMIQVKADAPDARFSARLGRLEDSEGNTVPMEGFAWGDPESDAEDAVSFSDVENSGLTVNGTVHFGKSLEDGQPALAHLKIPLLKPDGDVLLYKTLSVTVFSGDPVNAVGEFAIDGHPDDGTGE